MKKLLSPFFLVFIFLFTSCNNTSDIIVIGHRGAMGHALENTIESVEKAVNLNVDGIEIDVFKSKTGELIVYHDPSLKRLSNSTALIEDISLDSIKKVKLKGGLMIPILEEVIDVIPENIFLNIELKGKNTAYATNKIISEYLTRYNWPPSKFIISSFNWNELENFRSFNSEIPIAILTDTNPLNAIPVAKKLNAVAINPNYKLLNKYVVNQIKKEGLKIFPYTVNSINDIDKMKNLGVDGIITNYPERIK